MKFETNENLQAFLADKPFYKNTDCFCLGNSMSEAGVVVKQIVESQEKKGEAICGNGFSNKSDKA